MMWYGDTNGQTIVKISGAMLQNCQIARDKKNALLSGKNVGNSFGCYCHLNVYVE